MLILDIVMKKERSTTAWLALAVADTAEIVPVTMVTFPVSCSDCEPAR